MFVDATFPLTLNPFFYGFRYCSHWFFFFVEIHNRYLENSRLVLLAFRAYILHTKFMFRLQGDSYYCREQGNN